MSMERKGLQLKDGEPMADLPDLMNDWFFGSVKTNGRAYNLSGTSVKQEEEIVHGKSSTSSLTQEWLEEAKKMVAASPARLGSPSRLGVSPRFAASLQTREPAALLDRRDPLSRSARRHRSADGIGDEILQRTSARHSRNKSECFASSSDSYEPQSPTISADHHHPLPLSDDPRDRLPPVLLPKQPLHRKSRFHEKPPEPHPAASPRRTFRKPPQGPPPAAAEPDEQGLLLSPPRNLVVSAHRRSVSSSTCSLDKVSRVDGFVHGRSVSTSSDAAERRSVGEEDARQLNAFLRRQRAMIAKISRGELSAKAQIILSGSLNGCTTSSMVAAICYAWLLENREKEQGGSGVVVPVVSMKRGRMLKQKQAAWLFFHLGIDASALLFSDEVDLEDLIKARQLSILVIGQDVLKTNGEVGSQCTVLTDNYCEEAYDLLETPNLKKLLLAGILLDTQNLNGAAKFFTNRDAEAVQLLLVGSAPSLRHELFEQLMQDHRESIFLEVLRQTYGKPSNEDNYGSGESHEPRTSTRMSASISPEEVNIPRTAKQKPTPAPAPAPTLAPVKSQEIAPRGKNKFFLAKWFGFGSK